MSMFDKIKSIGQVKNLTLDPYPNMRETAIMINGQVCLTHFSLIVSKEGTRLHMFKGAEDLSWVGNIFAPTEEEIFLCPSLELLAALRTEGRANVSYNKSWHQRMKALVSCQRNN